MNNLPFTSFAQAVVAMPSCVMGNFDALSHTTYSDLAYCAQHELDMLAEGEDTDIKSLKDKARAESFLAKCRIMVLHNGTGK